MEIDDCVLEARARLADINWNDLVPLSTRYYCAKKIIDAQIKELTDMREYFFEVDIFNHRIDWLNRVKDEMFHIINS